jgi:acyl-CoA thioester hydrolase
MPRAMVEASGPIPGVYEHRHEVLPEEIDELDHVHNLHYLAWALAAAKAHSTAVGWPFARYAELGGVWVVRSHSIEYLRPARGGDAVVVRTWVTEMSRVTSRRKYEIVRPADATVLARAETQWVFVNMQTQAPGRVPEILRAAFPVVAR